MVININKGERFIPEAGGNDKDEKPIAFNLRYLTVADQDETEYWEAIASKADRVRLKTNLKDAFLRGVESIENCIADGKEIKTAQEFLALRGAKWLNDMMHEVALRIKNAAEVNEKN